VGVSHVVFDIIPTSMLFADASMFHVLRDSSIGMGGSCETFAIRLISPTETVIVPV
jgi:hypothetical protein